MQTKKSKKIGDRYVSIPLDENQTKYIPQGWQCPLCGRIYSPIMTYCPICNNSLPQYTQIYVQSWM